MIWIFLIPLMAISQNDHQSDYAVFENAMLTPQPDKIQQFEEGLAAHNKKFQAEGPYGARVYYISNGPNVGKYLWAMGPLPWSAMDERPDDPAHDDDWTNNVVKYMTPDSDLTYWRFNTQLSNFPKDFKVDKLLVDVYDTKRFEDERMMKAMEKVVKVMRDKYPDQPYGVYTNEMPATKDGRDLAMWCSSSIKWPGWEKIQNSWKTIMQFMVRIAGKTS